MKILKVSDEHRINELSLLPGGHEITVTYANGSSRVYDKVKSPKLYIKKLLSRKNHEIVRILVNAEVVWTNEA